MTGIRAGLLATLCAVCVHPQQPASGVSYFREIQPVIQRTCQGCHQPAMKSGGLDLTRYEGLVAGGSRGPAVRAGSPAQSLILAYVKGDRQPRMPFGGPPLPDDQIELFRRWIASGAKDDTPPEARDVAAVGQTPVYHRAPVITALAYSPDGSLLAVSGYREVLLHHADGSGLVSRLVGLSDRIQSVEFSRDGKVLVMAGGTPARFGEVQIWDVATRKLRHSVMLSNDTVFGASLSTDGSRVAVGCADNTVRLVDTGAGKEVLKMSHHENWVLGTVFGVDGKRVVSVGRDQAAKLTDATSGAFIENINALRGELAAIARHPTRDVILIGGAERIPYLYMMDRSASMKIADDSTLIRKFEMQEGAIFALAFSADGSRLTVAGASDEVPIYQTDTGERVATCKGPRGTYAVALSPDGAQLATGGFDGKVRIYEANSGKLTRDFVPVPVQTQMASAR